MKIKVSDYIVERLVSEGVKTIFGYQGGNISHMIDSICQNDSVVFIENYNEQGSAFAANAYAQVHQSLGVAVASSGPGAINLLNGIANAWCDSIPCIYFCGDVNTTAKQPESRSRQDSFQEIDIVPIVKPISKYCNSINNPDDVVSILEEAISAALSGRKGPAVINLPHDMQRSFIEIESMPKWSSAKSEINSTLPNEAFAKLRNAKRPVVLVGGGMKSEASKALLRSVLDKTPIPVVASLLGLDVLSHNHKCYRGFIGSYGNRAANLCLKYADYVLVLGSRIDDRQVSANDAQFFADKTVVHIDIDDAELCKKVKEDISIQDDVDKFLELMVTECIPATWGDWLEATKELQEEYPSYNMNEMHPNSFLRKLAETVNGNYTFDVGNNQMHSAQSVYLKDGSNALASGGLGSMGYSLPAAIGVACADRSKTAFCITGDGGLQMNIQELQTIALHDLPVNVIVLNNNALGMIYHLQTKMFPGRYFATTEGYAAPNLEKIAEAYGMKYRRVESLDDYETAIELLESQTRVLVDFVMKPETKPIPDVAQSIFNQSPSLTVEEIKRIENTLQI